MDLSVACPHGGSSCLPLTLGMSSYLRFMKAMVERQKESWLPLTRFPPHTNVAVQPFACCYHSHCVSWIYFHCGETSPECK